MVRSSTSTIHSPHLWQWSDRRPPHPDQFESSWTTYLYVSMYTCTSTQSTHLHTLIHSYPFMWLCIDVLSYLFTFMDLRTCIIVLIRMHLRKVRVFYDHSKINVDQPNWIFNLKRFNVYVFVCVSVQPTSDTEDDPSNCNTPVPCSRP